MKKIIIIAGVLLTCTYTTIWAQKVKIVEKFEVAPRQKVKVMILGTTHFANPGLDAVNMKVEDVLLPKRQKEIQEVSNLLAKFKPTKVMVEAKVKYQATHDERYQKYLQGKHKLTRNERQQLGYRLAKQMRHPKVYLVDHPGEFPMNEVVKYAKESGQFQVIAKGMGWAKGMMKRQEVYFKEHTIREFLVNMNQPAWIQKSNGFYLSLLAKVGKGSNYSGTDLVAKWYERNLKIYTNVLRQAEAGDRIVLIFGAGHVPILKHLFQDAIDFEYIEVNNFLDDNNNGK